MKYAIVATDNNPSYYFYAPIVSYFWNKLGYRTFIFTINDIPDFVKQTARDVGGYFWKLDKNYLEKLNPEFKKLPAGNMAAFSRLLAGMILDSGDYLLMSDIDMIPLDKEFFDYTFPNNKDMDLEICGEDATTGGYGTTRFTMCYIGGRLESWVNLFSNYGKIGSPIHYLKRVYEAIPNILDNQPFYHSLDELLVTELILTSGMNSSFCARPMVKNLGYTGQPHGVPGILPERRIDRSYWEYQEKAIDAHCPRDIFRPNFINDFCSALGNNISSNDERFLRNYHQIFIETLK